LFERGVHEVERMSCHFLFCRASASAANGCATLKLVGQAVALVGKWSPIGVAALITTQPTLVQTLSASDRATEAARR
jgi:hypothetical protein